MKGFRWCFSFVIALIALEGPVAYGASILTLTTNPISGALSGAPGQTVGWGFTLANSSNNIAVITSADFCPGVISSPCVTPLGTFTDFIGPSFAVIGPHASLSDVFNPATQTGIGRYVIKTTATPGTSFFGQIVLTFDTFDPTFTTQIASDDRVTSAASVSVSAVPEPSSLALLSSALAGLYMITRRRTSTSRKSLSRRERVG